MRERKRLRHPYHDYSSDGWYFVTMNRVDWRYWFGNVVDGNVRLNIFGEILQKCWFDLPNHYRNCVLDEMVIMPNHFHRIIRIDNSVNSPGTVMEGLPSGRTGTPLPMYPDNKMIW